MLSSLTNYPCQMGIGVGIRIGVGFQQYQGSGRAVSCRNSSGERGNKIEEELNNGEGAASVIGSPAEAVEIRFKRGSRRRRKQEQDDGDDVSDKMGGSKKAKKDWESMTLSEKAIEVYVGEKGLLFWLNKLAYASIFIIIGGWILFRFVGPALNLYQLDTPPLSPAAVFKQ